MRAAAVAATALAVAVATLASAPAAHAQQPLDAASPAAPPGYASAPPAPPHWPEAAPGAAPPGGYMMPQLPPWANPKTIEYEEGDPIPPGYQFETRADKALAIGGLTTFGTAYAISLVIGSAVLMSDDDDEGYAALLVPIAGPYIAINTLDAEGAGVFWLMVNGVMQTAGVAMLAAGLAAEDVYLKRQDVAAAGAKPSWTSAALRPTVMVGPGAATLRWRF